MDGKGFWAFVFLIFLISCTKPEEKPLNIILIHVDDLGWADIQPFGSDFYETPNLNRLAQEGTLFTNSYAAAAICSPTRAALLTGKYPARLGITDWIRAKFQGYSTSGELGEYEEFEARPLKTPKIQGYLPLEEETIAERMKKLGYQTLHLGKWHLGEEGFHPEDQGFDVNIGGNDLGQPPSYFDPYQAAQPREFYEMKNLPPRKKGEFLTDRESDELIHFIENKEKPFFVHWAPYAVHTPIMGPPDLVSKYEEKEKGVQRNPEYAALIENLDFNIGKLMDFLTEKGLRENTLLIFTSDNGGLIGNPDKPVTVNLGLRSQKGFPYEGGIRVPTIVSLPGIIPQGKEIEAPIITMDWIPTILEFVGFKSPDSELEGKSLKGLLTEKEELAERDLFWHFPHYRETTVIPYSIIRSGDWKLIHYYEPGMDELYNLANDREEKNNLFNEEPAIANELQAKLDQWLIDTEARMPIQKADEPEELKFND